jgi:hypothetical protein
MKLNLTEQLLVDNPLRALVQRFYEGPLLRELGGRLDKCTRPGRPVVSMVSGYEYCWSSSARIKSTDLTSTPGRFAARGPAAAICPATGISR